MVLNSTTGVISMIFVSQLHKKGLLLINYENYNKFTSLNPDFAFFDVNMRVLGGFNMKDHDRFTITGQDIWK